MDCSEYSRSVDSLIDGTLDFVEVAERRLHENQCSGNCLQLFVDRCSERLDERNTLVPYDPQTCLREETLRRWLDLDIPEELWPMVSDHLDSCLSCRNKATDIAVSMQSL